MVEIFAVKIRVLNLKLGWGGSSRELARHAHGHSTPNIVNRKS
jgi:hypothetical protein